MEELIPLARAALIITIITLAFLLFLAVRARLQYRANPKAPARFRVVMAFSALTAVAALAFWALPNALDQMIIEPVGGVDFQSDAGPRQYPSTEQSNQQPPDTTNRRPDPAQARASQTTPETTPETTRETIKDTTTWSGHGPLASSLRTNRIIVHTAETSILVKDIPGAIAHIEQTASNLGGWLVASEHDSQHSGSAAVRVPAHSLREAVNTIFSTATKIESIRFSSEDVTEEFIDVQSRLKVLETTEQNYIQLLAQATNLQINLEIRELLLQIRQEIEQLNGRLNYLSDVAAFSLINITISLAPAPMEVDAGEEITVQTNKTTDFNALITPPKGSTDISYTWDFGDGTPDYSGNRTALVFGTNGKRVTNPTPHTYLQEGKHIVHVEATAIGENGVAQGSDTLFVTVKDIPSIRLSLPTQNLTVEEGKELKIRAHFTRPAEIWDYEYIWNFGDSSPSTPAQMPQGITRLQGAHTYQEPTRQYIEGTLTISGVSDAGKISSKETFRVIVTESTSLFAGAWDIGGWAKGGVRAVFATLSVLTMLLIWLLIFSPLIAIIAGLIYFAYRQGWIGNKGVKATQT